MTLQEAIEEVKAVAKYEGNYEDYQFEDYFLDDAATAIATILNAVVNGDLTHSAPGVTPASAVSGEPHTEAGAGEGVEVLALFTDAELDELDRRLSRVGWYIIEGGKRYVDDAPIEARLAIQHLRAQLAEWQASQTYRYIGRGGKPVLARELEDRAERAEDQLAAMTAERDALVGVVAANCRRCNGTGVSGGSGGTGMSQVTLWKCDHGVPEHAATALDHIRDQAKAEGMREAAEIARSIIDGRVYFNERARSDDEAFACTILAAAQKEAGK